jgi:hypothetical protein
MNCQSFENVVVDLARLTPLEVSVRDAALAHCEGCDNCARRLTEEKLLTGGLMALATEMKSAVVADHVQQNLLSVLRQQNVAPQPERANSGWRYLAVAAAILVAVGLGIAGYKMRQAPPVDSQARSLPAAEIAVPVASTPPIKDSAESPTRKQKRTPTVAKKQRPGKFRPDASAHSTFVSVVVGTVTDPVTPEVVSHFMPLGDTNPVNIQDGAQVVRVELPRYAMARFGLPVNMERYDERVKADVWLGADGLARAIRFVQ